MNNNQKCIARDRYKILFWGWHNSYEFISWPAMQIQMLWSYQGATFTNIQQSVRKERSKNELNGNQGSYFHTDCPCILSRVINLIVSSVKIISRYRKWGPRGSYAVISENTHTHTQKNIPSFKTKKGWEFAKRIALAKLIYASLLELVNSFINSRNLTGDIRVTRWHLNKNEKMERENEGKMRE